MSMKIISTGGVDGWKYRRTRPDPATAKVVVPGYCAAKA